MVEWSFARRTRSNVATPARQAVRTRLTAGPRTILPSSPDPGKISLARHSAAQRTNNNLARFYFFFSLCRWERTSRTHLASEAQHDQQTNKKILLNNQKSGNCRTVAIWQNGQSYCGGRFENHRNTVECARHNCQYNI